MPPAGRQVYAALWLGALLVATDAAVDQFPAELHELARRYFATYPPRAKA